MNRRSAIELVVGGFVVLGLVALFVLALKMSNFGVWSGRDGYELTARFENVGGLKVQSPVSASGVRVGRVTGIRYDQENYQAVVTMFIDRRFDRFPTDTSAAIFTSGLLGEQFISLEPGAEETFLKDGDEITLTQSAFVLEKVLGQFLYNKAAE